MSGSIGPVFIMSSERSGSNLLRSILGAHPDIAAPPPPHLWLILNGVLPFLGSLADEKNLRHLISEALKMTNIKDTKFDWKHDIGVDEALERVRKRTLTGAIAAIYQAYSDREAKKTWACKEVNMFDFAYRILDVFPGAKFIYLVRDGRDVATSERRRPARKRHVFLIAERWRKEQLKCLNVLHELSQGGSAFLLRYEDLLDSPEEKVREMCHFIGVDFSPGMLNFHENPDTAKEASQSEYWKNIRKPIMKRNYGRFMKELSPRQIKLFEAVARETLEILGYPLVYENTRYKIGFLKEMRFRIANKLYRLLVALPRRAEETKKFHKARKSVERGIRSHGKPVAPAIQYSS